MNLTELGLTTEQITSIEKHMQEADASLRAEYERKLVALNEELAKYKPKEKTDIEKAFDERIKALEKREKQVAEKERVQAIKDSLKGKGIPEELASVLDIGDDVDAGVNKVSKILSGMKVGGSYNPNSHVYNKGVTKERFKSMTYMERSRLYNDNPGLYKRLTGQM